MKSVLLYYPFELAENANSGSKLRPKKIYQAFLDWGKEEGIEVLILSGDSATRNQMFNEWKEKGMLRDLLFCYMENQTIPIWLTDKGHIPKKPFVDLKVMKFLKNKNVPVGVFYRDVYWKFDELYPLKGIKKTIMKNIYKLEENFYQKYTNVIFLPSEAMGEYVNIDRRHVPLPPGGEKRIVEKNSDSKGPQGLYVGGINNEDYGLFLLLDAIELVNNGAENLQLTVVCREDEYLHLPNSKKDRLNKLNVDIQHISGEALNDLYTKMDFAFIPRFKSTYNDFSVPVKLVEYLSNELPIIATNCTAQKEIIETDNYGVICNDNATDMSEAIKLMIKESAHFRENIQRTFEHKHSWKARVKKVEKSLLEEEL